MALQRPATDERSRAASACLPRACATNRKQLLKGGATHPFWFCRVYLALH